MADMTWLATEAKNIHALFSSIFFALVLVLLIFGVIVEYFKWPIGGAPVFGPLVGRVLIAAILLYSYPEITNLLADLTDALSKKLGDFNEIKMVLSKMGDKYQSLTWSLMSAKDFVVLAISFITFFLLYFSVYVADAFMLYTWTLLYVCAPILIALFVLPQTAGATKALYRSLIEVSAWKVVWSVLATLLWSAALSKINQPGQDIHFLSAVCFNLILAGSIILTPIVVHGLAGAGLATMARTVGSIAVGGTVLAPAKILSTSGQKARHGYQAAIQSGHRFTENRYPKAHSLIKRLPGAPKK